MRLEVFISDAQLSIPTCCVMGCLVGEHFYPNWFWVVFQCIWETSLWMRNIIPLQCIFLSFIYTLYEQDSVIELSIFFIWMVLSCVWWKSRNVNKSSCLPIILVIFMLMNFIPFLKLILFGCTKEDVLFLPSIKDSDIFSFSGINWSSKKELEKTKTHFGHIQVNFEFSKVSC